MARLLWPVKRKRTAYLPLFCLCLGLSGLRGLVKIDPVTAVRRRGVQVHLGTFSHELLSASYRGVISATGHAGTATVNPVPLPAGHQVCYILHSPRISGSSHRRFRDHARHHVVSVCRPSSGAVSTLVGLSLPTNISVRIGL